MDNYFSDTHNDIFRFLLINSSFLFSWCELIIYIIAIYKYGNNYWYRISVQSFQFPYTNLNLFTERTTNSRESEQNSESNDVQIDIEADNNDDLTLNNSETSRTLQENSINNENDMISQIEPTIEEVSESSSAVKCNTLPNHLSLKSFSPFSPFNDDNNNLFESKKESKPNKSDTIFFNKNENNDDDNKTKKHYIDKQLPIVMFENFKKNNKKKKSEEEEIIQKIIEEIELFYDRKEK
ncbi:hypothetical protein H8356DRAFT_956908 [Neocallimastix lanati (nom. inval.)]|uniref:Uncharacterized protein n=1 Tax=Neocallimastix californiae TaxID=1754190 RepID=A0A1Y2AGR7_9FUNG|nr:hypothetical protein H8356DRAFT_956908 [Neocallimastix sp. JGI-2020a]ORY21769.1 hypothetical protein LY90DRAFT_515897 [Neocallimastix californiae]|eukprot:ORY21769.1 hypothetical protein LY90DRAFT_515897 [Neocallimastix californiae]